MKITAVDIVRVTVPAYDPPFVWRRGLPGSEPAADAAWLLIRTDSEHVGISFHLRGATLQDVVDRRLRSELVGQDPLAREYLWERLWEIDRIDRFPIFIFGVIDDALWDIGGKVAGLPLNKLLGNYREEIPAYASTVTYSTLDEYLAAADQCLELGFPAIKLHAWGDVKADAQLSMALRKHVGPDVPLMYDGSAGFDLMEATYLGKVLADADYLWYEEPMKEFSVHAYARLAERVDVPLLVGEVTEGSHHSAGDFIASNCAAAVRVSHFLRGGVTGAMRIAHLADAYHLRAEVHGGGLVSRHLCMAIKNNTYYEALVTSFPVKRPSEVDDRGMVRATTTPGNGWEELWAQRGFPPELKDAGIPGF
jgi:L-alanine-DL-glutamate epimerase-like enolase superfamily enzyme